MYAADWVFFLDLFIYSTLATTKTFEKKQKKKNLASLLKWYWFKKNSTLVLEVACWTWETPHTYLFLTILTLKHSKKLKTVNKKVWRCKRKGRNSGHYALECFSSSGIVPSVEDPTLCKPLSRMKIPVLGSTIFTIFRCLQLEYKLLIYKNLWQPF